MALLVWQSAKRVRTYTMLSVDLLAFMTAGSADKVIGSFDLLSASRSVGAATNSGGIYIPKSDTYTIPNPAGQKATITMIWSIDGTNWYPQKPWIYQPGNPVPSGVNGATMGAMVDDSTIYFYSVHYLGSTVNYQMKYVLDFIEG